MPRMSLIETFFNWAVFVGALPALLEGLGVTVMLGAVSIVAGTLSGLAMALIRLYGPAPMRWLARVYIDAFRSIPLLVLLVLVYYALPFVGVRFSSFVSAALAISLVSCAYAAEIFRAGIQSVAKGQREAAQTLGLSSRDAFRFVIFPQAIRIILPALGNQFVYVMKMSSLVSVIGLQELTRRANELNVSEYRPLEIYTALVVEYLLLILLTSWGVRRLEKRLSNGLR
jgi:polar amino acid transport system permease protein